MRISKFMEALKSSKTLQFALPDGSFVPSHFHITEIGKSTKEFVDCGGVFRKEESITFQLLVGGDIDHRLSPTKVLGLIESNLAKFTQDDLEVDFEYQQSTLSKYGVEWQDGNFGLTTKATACLAVDGCGFVPLTEVLETVSGQSCSPGSGCC
jgi:hypothetical protein